MDVRGGEPAPGGGCAPGVTSPAVGAAAGAGGTGTALLAARAAATPDRVAVSVEGSGDLTDRAWHERSAAIARGLAGRDVGPGDRVALRFSPARWADFAAAYVGVRACGAAAVLLSAGAARPDLARALAHAGARGVVCGSPPVEMGGAAWVATVEEVERGGGPAGAPVGAARSGEPTEDVVYLDAPLAPPALVLVRTGDGGVEQLPPLDGWLVHAWSPGSIGGHAALRALLGGSAVRLASLDVFDPGRFGALAARRGAVACGLTPALAAAVVAWAGPHRAALRSVRHVVLSGEPSDALRTALDGVFPAAAVVVLGEAPPRPGAESSAPAAVSQRPMLWHEQFAPGSFNLPCLVRRYEGRLDVEALHGAMSELVLRHEPLRTTFTLRGDGPRLVVGDAARFHLPILDLSGWAPHQRDGEVARLLAEASARPFDLVRGPLFEPMLVRLGPDDHLLVVRLHHTVFDDWSVDVFRRELSALYAARLEGATAPLAPVASFADACRRERAVLDSEAGASQQAWWRRELAGAPLAVQLPLGRPERAGQEGAGPLRVDVPPALAARVRALAPRLRATPFMTVLAAFSLLVGDVTGLDDLVIATVVAHRNRSELEPLIGCFTKKVPLRLRLGGDPTFAELVARTRASLLGALARQDVAFDAAVEQALGEAAAAHGVVPQVAVVFQGEAPRQVTLSLPGLATAPFDVPERSRQERHFSAGPERADEGPAWGDGLYLGTFLILSLVEAPEGLALVARGVFDRAEGRRFLSRFEAVLEQAAAAPDRRVSELRGEGPTNAAPEDVLDLRGLRASRADLEAALSKCAGVGDVAVAVCDGPGGEPRVVAYVVADGERPPSLGDLRAAVWRERPGALWPAAAVVVDALPGRADGQPLPAPGPASAAAPGPLTALGAALAAMWGELARRPVAPDATFWQDFSFLAVLAEARAAGIPISDEDVVRTRTLETLVAAVAARCGRSRT